MRFRWYLQGLLDFSLSLSAARNSLKNSCVVDIAASKQPSNHVWGTWVDTSAYWVWAAQFLNQQTPCVYASLRVPRSLETLWKQVVSALLRENSVARSGSNSSGCGGDRYQNRSFLWHLEMKLRLILVAFLITCISKEMDTCLLTSHTRGMRFIVDVDASTINLLHLTQKLQRHWINTPSPAR